MAHHPPAPLALPDGRPLHVAADQLRDGEGLALPPVFSFAAVIGGASKTYYHDRFDEAMRHSRENALAMRRDCFLMSLLQERKMAVSSLPWYLETPDPKDRRQAKVRAVLTQCLRGTRGLRRMILAWLESIWYGRYGVQFSWRWGHADGRKVLAVDRWAPVNGDKIGYHWDGTPYVLVNAARAANLPGVVLTNTTRARALSLVGGWRDRFVVHMHDIDDADFFEAEAAAGRHGVGVRSRVYWLDFLKREYLDWVVTYLERVGLGTTLWKYDASSPEQKSAAESAARDNSRRVNITVPVWPDRSGGYAGGVERIEAPMGGVEALRTMIEAMDQYIERYIIGQSGSSQSQSSGLGNEAASEFMSSTKDAIRDHDAHLLAETITGSEGEPGLLSLMQRYSFPETMPENSDGFPVLFKFGLEKSLNNQRIQTIGQVSQMGLPVRKDDIYNAAGLSRPEDHDDVLEPQQQGGPGGAGGDPLAALMGGGGPPGDDVPSDGGDGAPASEEDVDSFLSELFGEDADGGTGGEPEEDRASEEDVDGFLAELFGEGDDQPRQMARQGGGVEQYGWEMTRELDDGRKRWKGTEEDKGKYRTQKIKPGTRVKSSGDNRRSIGEHIDTLLESPESFTPGHRDDLRSKLLTLTRDQFATLRSQFGIRKKGRRKEDEINTLLEGVEERKKPKAEEAKAVEPPKKKKWWEKTTEEVRADGVPPSLVERFRKGGYSDPEGLARNYTATRVAHHADEVKDWYFGGGDDGEGHPDVKAAEDTLERAGGRWSALLRQLDKMIENDDPGVDSESHPVNREMNKMLVAEILRAGKRVPPEVLADYPDLASQYGPQEGDTNAEGLVFRDGHWRREEDPRPQRNRQGLGQAKVPENRKEFLTSETAERKVSLTPQPGNSPAGGQGETKMAETEVAVQPKTAEEWKQFHRRPVGAANKGNRGRLVISGKTREIKDLLKARGWKYDAATQTWSNDLVAAHADIVRDGGDPRVEFLKGLNGWKKGVRIQLDGEDVFVEASHPMRTSQQPATQPVARVRHTSGKSGAPVVGQFLRNKDGSYVVVTGVGRSVYNEDEDRWAHSYETRDATSEEGKQAEKRSKIAELKKDLAFYEGPIDDDRNAERHAEKAAELRRQLAELENE